MRIAIGGLEHETNTYATDSMGPTGRDQFQQLRGDQLLEMAGTRTFIGGLLAGAEAAGADVVPTFWAWAGPSGIIEAQAYESLKRELVERVTAALPLDAIAVSMHGAGVVEDIDDLEGDLAAALRLAVGPDTPIVVPLDLHGNITAEMGAHIDLMLGVHHYPHTDMFERGVEAIEALPSLVDRTWRPTTHVERVPLLLPTSTTDAGPAAAIRDRCLAAERNPGVIDATFFHGFPYTDVATTGSAIVVTTDDNPRLAQRLASELAAELWSTRADFIEESVPPEVAIELGRKHLTSVGGPVIINDTADNPGGGTPGDGTHLLRALVDADIADSCFGFIFDPAAVARATEAGVGSTIELRIGGHHGALHGDPLEATVHVKSLTDGRFTHTSPMLAGVRANLGPCARVVVGNVDIIITSRRNQTFDQEVFLLHGIDVRRRSIVALKSSQHFRDGFRDLASTIITADSPGLTTLDVTVFDHPNADGPRWPIDPRLEWDPSPAGPP
jgi:microcystin degradation protein MlrC